MAEKVKFCKNCKSVGHPTLFTNGYFVLDESIINCPIRSCSSKLENIDFDVKEFELIEDISRDTVFLEAMIQLKEDDPIEYQLKMSQFKANLSQQESIAKKTTNKVTCPYCQSTNTKKIDGTERIASVAMLGIFSKKINKSFKCRECGGTF